MEGWMDGQTGEWMDGQVNEWMIKGWMDDGWMDGWMRGKTNR